MLRHFSSTVHTLFISAKHVHKSRSLFHNTGNIWSRPTVVCSNFHGLCQKVGISSLIRQDKKIKVANDLCFGKASKGIRKQGHYNIWTPEKKNRKPYNVMLVQPEKMDAFSLKSAPFHLVCAHGHWRYSLNTKLKKFPATKQIHLRGICRKHLQMHRLNNF